MQEWYTHNPDSSTILSASSRSAANKHLRRVAASMVRKPRLLKHSSAEMDQKGLFLIHSSTGTWIAFRDSYNTTWLVKTPRIHDAGRLPAEATSARRHDSIAFKPVSQKPRAVQGVAYPTVHPRIPYSCIPAAVAPSFCLDCLPPHYREDRTCAVQFWD